MGVAFDPEKDASNIAKNGISPARAVEMDMAAALVHEDDRFDYGETRYIAFGEIEVGRYASAEFLRIADEVEFVFGKVFFSGRGACAGHKN